MRRSALVAVLLLLFAAAARAEEPAETLLLQTPTISAEHVVFVYAGDLWVVGRNGGDARRLTSGAGEETEPKLSPDGRLVAFTGEYEGNGDVWVIPVGGGEPRRLTWHPRYDMVHGWHPDGRRVLFTSMREGGTPVPRPYLVSIDGGMPERLPIPEAYRAAYHGGGGRLAFTPHRDAFHTWKRYRGGTAPPIWILDLESLDVTVVPRDRESDSFPCFLGGTLYFLSDRGGLMNVWSWRPGDDAPTRVTDFVDIGVCSLSAGAGRLVFARAGAIHVLDPKAGEPERLRIRVVTDGLARRPRWQEVKGFVRDAAISPHGKRAVFEARGDIVTVPREHGDPRNLTASPGAHDRSPAWSPDGQRIAWFTDESGEYRLVVGDRLGREATKSFDLGGAPFYYAPKWSPDGTKVLFFDRSNRLAFVDLESGAVTEVDRSTASLGVWGPRGVWSPDGRWIAYEYLHPMTEYGGVGLFEVATGRKTTVTDAFADAGAPAFSPDGAHLCFRASVDSGPSQFGLDLGTRARRRPTASLYVAVLAKDGKDPLAPRSDDETPEEGKPEKPEKKEPEEKKDGAGKEEEPAPATVDVEGLDQRILALPVPAGEITDVRAVKGKVLFLVRADGGKQKLRSFSFKDRKTEDVLGDVASVAVSADGEHLLVRQGGRFAITDASGKDRKDLRIDDVKVRVVPDEEWPQILREAWRLYRDYFYDPRMHGVDWDAMWERWSAFLPHVRSRDDLNVVLAEMVGELCCGHVNVWGGDRGKTPEGAGVGLLGADFAVDAGGYRITRIYRGRNWDPRLRAPLTVPGVDVKEGDRLVTVDGRPVDADRNLYSYFEGRAGRQVEIGVAAEPGGPVRTSTVVPVSDDFHLRRMAWVEANRRRVDELSGGRLAYVYLPNTGGAGLAAFDRDFYSQLDREGVVVDERFNGGGQSADLFGEVLSREPWCYWRTRDRWLGRTPFGSMTGPKVMLINERAGSGGDALPYFFRKLGLGPLVGTRTWGGLVGISGNPGLVDGGYVSVPEFGIQDLDGNWIIENEGVPPDVEVVQWPKEVEAGRDPQLTKAVEIALAALAKSPPRPEPEYRPPAPR